MEVKTMLSDIHLVQETNFNRAYWQAIQNVLKSNRIGTQFELEPMCFGTAKAPKYAYDSCQLIELTGNAIRQVLNKEVHPLSTFKSMDSYVNELTPEWLENYQNEKDPNKKFDYTYVERLMEYANLPDVEEWGTYDQISNMFEQIDEQIKTEIASNFCQAITWYVERDGTINRSSPCLQRIWSRWYPGNLIDLHFEWRSRDLIHAWQPNIVALTQMMQNMVFEPNDCKLTRIVDFSDSLHIYKGDIEEAKRIYEIR